MCGLQCWENFHYSKMQHLVYMCNFMNIVQHSEFYCTWWQLWHAIIKVVR